MFSLAQKIAFFDDFVSRNAQQIDIKARASSFEKDEVKSELFILVAEKLCEFDPTKGSVEAFFFSSLHEALARFNRDVCTKASSLDTESQKGFDLKDEVENTEAITSRP